MLRRVRILLVIASASSVFAAGQAAFAQGAPAPAAPAPAPSEPRALVVLDAGTAFGNTEAHLAYQGGLGIALGTHIQILGEFGRFDNIVTKTLHDNFRDTAAELSQTLGSAVSPTSTVAANYGLVDLRLLHRVSKRVGVFLDIGAGVARVQPQFSATAAGVDVTSEVLQAVAIPSAQTALYAAAGGGFRIQLTHRATIDAGYSFGRINASPPMNTNTLYGGWTVHW